MDALRIVLACVKNANETFNLISDGDRIAVGVSGGKDSMVLLYALNLFKKFSKIDFEIVPICMDLGFDGFEKENISQYVKTLGYDLHVVPAHQVYEILSIQKERQHLPHLPCSICSRMKKAIINKEAHKLNCNKVSFAHHKTDAVETLFLNEIYGGRIATFSPKMFLENEKITFIRPLILVDEKDIKRLCKENNIPSFSSHCPNDGHTKRETIKNLVLDINSNFPDSKTNFLTMLMNDEKEDVFSDHYEQKIDTSNLWYKKITNLKDYFIETKYIKKVSLEINQNSDHYHIYNKDEFVGAFIINQKDHDFIIEKFYIKKVKYLIPFVFSFYKNTFRNINPINLYIKTNKRYEDCFIKMYAKKVDEGLYLINENPIQLDHKLKKNKII